MLDSTQGDRRPISACGSACRNVFGLLLVSLLAACAGVPRDGWQQVQAQTASRGLDWPQQAGVPLEKLQAQPLDPATAVAVALTQSPELRALAARLDVAAAEVYGAGRGPNPVLDLRYLGSSVAGLAAQTTLGLSLAFTDWLLQPQRLRLGEAEYAVQKQRVARDVQRLAVEVEQAWYALAAAEQVARLRERIATAAEGAAELARRMQAAGTIQPRDLALEQANAAQARLDLIDAQQSARQARIDLLRRMGLGQDTPAWPLAKGLPPLPAADPPLEGLQTMAMENRLDLQAARQEADLRTGQSSLARTRRVLPPLQAGLERERETDGERLQGGGLAVELPIFDRGDGRVSQADAQHALAAANLAAMTLDVQGEVARAGMDLQLSRERLLLLRDTLIPQRAEAYRQAQREFNFMLIGAFELITVRQQQYAAYAQYLQTLGGYWSARAALELAVGRSLPGDASHQQDPGTTPVRADDLDAPDAAGQPMHHMHHMQHGTQHGMQHEMQHGE